MRRNQKLTKFIAGRTVKVATTEKAVLIPHGFTEHIFGLCYLLGYSFMPRLRDLADQHLYKMGRQADHECLDPLFHGVADTHLLREQWDSLVRVAASLKSRAAPTNVIVQRLANASSSDRLAYSNPFSKMATPCRFIGRVAFPASSPHLGGEGEYHAEQRPCHSTFLIAYEGLSQLPPVAPGRPAMDEDAAMAASRG